MDTAAATSVAARARPAPSRAVRLPSYRRSDVVVAVSSRSGSVPCSRSWPTRAAIAYGGDGGELALPPELRHRARQRVDHLGGLPVGPHLVGVAPGQLEQVGQ